MNDGYLPEVPQPMTPRELVADWRVRAWEEHAANRVAQRDLLILLSDELEAALEQEGE